MYPSRYHARTTSTGGKIPLGRRSETPVRECPIAYLALIAIRTILLFICRLLWNCLIYLPLLLLTALYMYICLLTVLLLNNLAQPNPFTPLKAKYTYLALEPPAKP